MNVWARICVSTLVVAAFSSSAAMGMNQEFDAAISRVNAPDRLQIGRTGRVTVTVTNEGTFDWNKVNPKLTSRIVSGPNGCVVNDQIAPSVGIKSARCSGDTWTFQYDIEGPDTPGTYELQWQMADARGKTFGKASSRQRIEVYGVDLAARISKSSIKYTPNPVPLGKSFRFKVVVTDSGDVPFNTISPSLHSTVVKKPSGATTTSLQQSFDTRSLRPDGKEWTFEGTMQAPKTEGAYDIKWQMYHGSSSFGESANMTLNVVK
ncbi:MAG: hypothetical protein IPM23_12365 [Candidatus Melainabacteria bacterium]|nr:hypothetical protein [Candidatus Melainabacteria bacterium]